MESKKGEQKAWERGLGTEGLMLMRLRQCGTASTSIRGQVPGAHIYTSGASRLGRAVLCLCLFTFL